MRVLFARNVNNLDTVRICYHSLSEKELYRFGEKVVVTKYVNLSNEDFNNFTNNLLDQRKWISDYKSGFDHLGRTKVISVKNVETGQRVFINPEGFNYASYTGIEII